MSWRRISDGRRRVAVDCGGEKATARVYFVGAFLTACMTGDDNAEMVLKRARPMKPAHSYRCRGPIWSGQSSNIVSMQWTMSDDGVASPPRRHTETRVGIMNRRGRFRLNSVSVKGGVSARAPPQILTGQIASDWANSRQLCLSSPTTPISSKGPM
jgi:hypothetical protein